MICEIKLSSKKRIEIIDITDQVRKIVADSGVQEGSITIISRHTTAAININEKEDVLLGDMTEFLAGFIPSEAKFAHDTYSVDGRANARSHLMALFTNASETVPILSGEMVLGDWQSVFFIEMDGPRDYRTVIVQVMGE